MIPEGITIHNTANDASAMSEISYMMNNNMQVSFHEAIDDYRCVQGIEHNRNAWHAGDGHQFGNMRTIGIEICYSKSGGERFEKAEKNAAERIAFLMKQYGWNLNNITDTRHTIGTHQNRSGKYCPHRTLDLGLERFYNMIREEYRELTGENTQGNPNIVVNENNNSTGRNIGDIVQINGIYTSSSSTRKLNPSIKSGMITRIISGAKNPYLLNNGDVGWVNDGCIISTSGSKVETTSSAPNISVGSVVVLSGNADRYATGQKIPNVFKNRKYTIQQVGSGKVLLKELYSWVYTSDLVGYSTNQSQNTNQVSSSKFVLGLYVVNTSAGLNVRSGAGTNYGIKKAYPNGTRFDTYEIKGDWARTPSGWVNLNYCTLVRKY